MPSLRSPIDWARYLDEFHASRPGITEEVLGRARVGPCDPYRWLVEGIDLGARIFDLGCGSGPSRPHQARRWVGLDRSAGELARAADAGRGPLLRGDAPRLPVADASIDVVVNAIVFFTAFLARPSLAPWLFSAMAVLVAVNVVQRLAWAGRHVPRLVAEHSATGS